jgi:hypothetical protein
MGTFLDSFPKLLYNINNNTFGERQLTTDISFRVGIIKSVLNNYTTYLDYTVGDGETPEILADKFYENPEYHWIILYANDIFDPQYDWPLEYRTFRKYIADKYRSLAGGNSLTDSQVIAWSQNTDPNSNSIHHFEKVVEQFDSRTQTITLNTYDVNKSNIAINLTSDLDGVPYKTFDTLEETGEFLFINFPGINLTTRQRTFRKAVTYFEYEDQLNEQKRNIKIIKKQYVSQINRELEELAGTADVGIRRLF